MREKSLSKGFLASFGSLMTVEVRSRSLESSLVSFLLPILLFYLILFCVNTSSKDINYSPKRDIRTGLTHEITIV